VEHVNGYVIWGCVHGHVQGRRAECNENTRDEGMQLPGMDNGWMHHKGAILKRYDSRVAIKERFSNGTTVVLRYVLTHLLAVQTRGLREVARSCLLGFLKLHDSFCRVHRSMLQLQLQFYLGLNMLGI